MIRSSLLILSLVIITVSLSQCSSDSNNHQADSSLQSESGDLKAYLENISYGEINDSKWQLPDETELAGIESTVAAILEKRYDEAASEAKQAGMELIAYEDNVSNRTYYLLQEDAGAQKGAGYYLFAPDGRDVVFQVPHPMDDLYTNQEGIELFFEVGAKALLLAGSSRFSVESSAMCQSDYHDSDAAHNDSGYFFHVHRAISKTDTDLLFVELHGFGSDSLTALEGQCGTATNGNLLNISEGMAYDGNLSETYFAEILLGETKRSGGLTSCLYSPANNLASSDIYSSTLGGTMNVAGRFTNGSGDVCTAPGTLNSHRFIHLEQSFNLRSGFRSELGGIVDRALRLYETKQKSSAYSFAQTPAFDESFDNTTLDSSRWVEANWSFSNNATLFRPENVTVVNGYAGLTLKEETVDSYSFTGGHLQTIDQTFGYGRYEIRMQPMQGSGMVSSFFLFWDEQDQSSVWNEIDIEFIQGEDYVQFNHWDKPLGMHEHGMNLGFDAAAAFHTYWIDYLPDYIAWYVDGKMVYAADEELPDSQAMRIMMNAWRPVGSPNWAGDPTTTLLPQSARYDFVRYYPLEQ